MTLEVDNELSRVTTEKIKNPGRQEWGRKLGKMQKELKAKKLNELTNERLLEQNPETRSCSFLKWEYVVTAVGLAVAALALYYQKKSYEVQISSKQATNRATDTNVQLNRFSDF